MKKRILIADDQAGIRSLLQDLFEMEGYLVATVSNGLEAIARVQNENIDLIILDMKMPGITGLEAARRILAQQDLPIILMTGLDIAEIEAEALAIGVKGCLTKPFAIQELKDIAADSLK